MTTHELRIERLSKLGEGVAQLEGRTVFVQGALPGEKVRVNVEAEGRVLRGSLVEVLEPSQSRRAPACPLADRCGGCDWLHAAEPLQRQAKEEIVLSALEHLGGIPRSALELRPMAVSPRSMGYRRRAVLHPAEGGLGFFGRRSHQRVRVERCPALVASIERLPGELVKALGSLLKHIEELTLLAEGTAVSFAVRLTGPVRPKQLQIVENAVRALELLGAVVVPQEGPVRMIGRPALRGGLPLTPEIPIFVRPDAFAQANLEANFALVAAAVNLLAARPEERALELYCGNGNFTFAIAGTAQSVLAVESSSASIELAQRSAREARVENVRFVQGDVAKVVQGLVNEQEQFDVLLADPPRTGAPGLAGWATRLGVKRLVYVACDPASLARDASELVAAGFRPSTLQLVDLFPQTRHIEALLSFLR